MAEINWTRESAIWLEDIYDFIAVDDPEAAARTIANIYEKAQLLRRHPELGLGMKARQGGTFEFFSTTTTESPIK